MKLYNLALSGHAHRAKLFASLLGLQPQIVPVDLLAGAHKQADYLKKNPFGQVPALEDGEDTIFDSNAILVYLARKYDTSNNWYPSDALAAAQVQIWLSKAANELANSVAAARLVTVFNAPYDHEALKKKAHNLLQIMDAHLANRSWFVGEKPTIADVALYSYTAHAPEGGVDLSAYKNIRRWLKAIEALPGFVAMPDTETQAKAQLSA
jgi:glutathione S-transferase